MSTPQNDGDPTPRPDAKENSDSKESPDVKGSASSNEGSDAKSANANEGSDAKKSSDANEGSKRKTTDERLSDLQERREQLNNRISTLMVRKRSRERKQDTRRKIIIGGVMLLEAGKNDKTHAWLRAKIGKHVKKERDRELFADFLSK